MYIRLTSQKILFSLTIFLIIVYSNNTSYSCFFFKSSFDIDSLSTSTSNSKTMLLPWLVFETQLDPAYHNNICSRVNDSIFYSFTFIDKKQTSYMFNIYPWENIMYSGSASYIPYPLMTYGYINLIEDYDTFSFYKGIEKYVFTNNLNTKWTVMGKWNGKTIRCCSIFLTDREINVSVKELQNLKTKERNKLIFNCIVYRIMNMIHYKKLKKASQGTYFSGESVRFIYSDADCSNVNIPNEKPNIPVPEN